MYTKYSYIANITQAALLSDIMAILTGVTDKSTLSAFCDQANTEILATYDPAGWVLHDDAAGTNAKVIKAACDGDAAQFKYVKISTNSLGYLWTGVYHAWNEITHIGTNEISQSVSINYTQRYSTTQPGTIYISASNRRIIIWGISAAGNGAVFAPGSSSYIVEADRGYTWCAVGQGYTPVGFGYSSYFGMPRHIGVDGNAYTSGTQGIAVSMGKWIHTGSGYIPVGGIGVPMSNGYGILISEIMVGNNGQTSPCLSGFSKAEVYSSWSGMANTLDETTFNGKTFIMFPLNDTGLSSKLAVPKG